VAVRAWQPAAVDAVGREWAQQGRIQATPLEEAGTRWTIRRKPRAEGELAAGSRDVLERASDALGLGRTRPRTATALPRAQAPSTRRLGCIWAAIPSRTP
jgi:hypothetical protein